jgi:hypothetical protein
MSPLSKSIIILLFLTFSVSFLTFYKSNAQQQRESPAFKETERAIRKNTDFNPPVSIKAVKTKGRSVPLDEKFIDEDDWLKGFTVSVRNDSNKTVTHIGIRMVFRRADERTEYPAAWILDYGPDPFFFETAAAVPRSPVPRILPGGELELKLGDEELEDLKKLLRKVGFPDNIHAVEIRVETIGFADGTAWYGRMLKRGSDGIKWKRVDTPGGPLYNHPQGPKASVKSSPPEFFFASNLSAAFQLLTTTPTQPLNPQSGCSDYWPSHEECSWPNQPDNCVAPKVIPTGEGLNEHDLVMEHVQCRLWTSTGGYGADCGGTNLSPKIIPCPPFPCPNECNEPPPAYLMTLVFMKTAVHQIMPI